MRSLLAIPIVLLASCDEVSWQQRETVAATGKIQASLNDQHVRFSAVQVVGDSATGQVCGKVFGKDVSTSQGRPARFIVYIDGTAGPWIEGQHGHIVVSDERFDFAWEYDCVKEGWGKT